MLSRHSFLIRFPSISKVAVSLISKTICYLTVDCTFPQIVQDLMIHIYLYFSSIFISNLTASFFLNIQKSSLYRYFLALFLLLATIRSCLPSHQLMERIVHTYFSTLTFIPCPTKTAYHLPI